MVKEHISIGMHGVVKGYRKQLNNYLPEILIPLFLLTPLKIIEVLQNMLDTNLFIEYGLYTSS
jgi:hypothetical protein